MVSEARKLNRVNVVAAGYSHRMFVSVYKRDHMTCLLNCSTSVCLCHMIT